MRRASPRAPRFALAARMVAVATLALVVPACTRANGTPASAGTFVFTGLAGEPDSLDPMLSGMSDVYSLSHLYLSYLVESDDRGRLVPEIALRVPTRANGDVSADGKTVVYHLRRGVRWQDGAPLTAADVVFSYRAVMNPANNVVTRDGYTDIASVEARGRNTVVVRLRRPFSPLTAYFFGPQGVAAILPAHLLARYPNLNRVPFNQRPVGSGPYEVVDWRHGDSISFEANALYWRGRPHIAKMRYRIIPDPNTRLEELQTGEVDAYFDVDPQLLPQLRRMRDVIVAMTPVNDVHELIFNVRDPLLSDVRLRQAIARGIDRPKLIASATHGAGIAIDGDQPFNGWAYDSKLPKVTYDPAAAGRLLDSAGWRMGADGVRAKDGRRLELTLAISPQGVNGSPLAAAVIQENLRLLGIAVTIKQYPFTGFYAPKAAGGVLASGQYQLAYSAWWLTGPDPDDTWNFACDEIPPNGTNVYFWCDPKADAAMHAALLTTDRTQRIADYAVVQREIVRELPELSLWQVVMPNAYRPNLRGFAPSPFGSAFWNAWSWQLK